MLDLGPLEDTADTYVLLEFQGEFKFSDTYDQESSVLGDLHWGESKAQLYAGNQCFFFKQKKLPRKLSLCTRSGPTSFKAIGSLESMWACGDRPLIRAKQLETKESYLPSLSISGEAERISFDLKGTFYFLIDLPDGVPSLTITGISPEHASKAYYQGRSFNVVVKEISNTRYIMHDHKLIGFCGSWLFLHEIQPDFLGISQKLSALARGEGLTFESHLNFEDTEFFENYGLAKVETTDELTLFDGRDLSWEGILQSLRDIQESQEVLYEKSPELAKIVEVTPVDPLLIKEFFLKSRFALTDSLDIVELGVPLMDELLTQIIKCAAGNQPFLQASLSIPDLVAGMNSSGTFAVSDFVVHKVLNHSRVGPDFCPLKISEFICRSLLVEEGLELNAFAEAFAHSWEQLAGSPWETSVLDSNSGIWEFVQVDWETNWAHYLDISNFQTDPLGFLEDCFKIKRLWKSFELLPKVSKAVSPAENPMVFLLREARGVYKDNATGQEDLCFIPFFYFFCSLYFG